MSNQDEEEQGREYYLEVARRRGLPFVDLHIFKTDSPALRLLTQAEAEEHQALPLKRDGNNIWIALANVDAPRTLQTLRHLTGCCVKPVVAIPKALSAAIRSAYAPPAPHSTNPFSETYANVQSLQFRNFRKQARRIVVEPWKHVYLLQANKEILIVAQSWEQPPTFRISEFDEETIICCEDADNYEGIMEGRRIDPGESSTDF